MTNRDLGINDLTNDEVIELAGICLNHLTESDAIQAIVDFVIGDSTLTQELINELEK
jgi:hypothetical protein